MTKQLFVSTDGKIMRWVTVDTDFVKSKSCQHDPVSFCVKKVLFAVSISYLLLRKTFDAAFQDSLKMKHSHYGVGKNIMEWVHFFSTGKLSISKLGVSRKLRSNFRKPKQQEQPRTEHGLHSVNCEEKMEQTNRLIWPKKTRPKRRTR